MKERCHVCHRALRDPVSCALGIGPVCRARLGVKVAPATRQRTLPAIAAKPETGDASRQLSLFGLDTAKPVE